MRATDLRHQGPDSEFAGVTGMGLRTWESTEHDQLIEPVRLWFKNPLDEALEAVMRTFDPPH
jgi:hypothetical protein